ncbi:BTAD domain-containing putative transcriptional regulator [Salininema proteolyticum]|uniref:BTAD domain-containing putative transcriptional regulator n=1 Tax=Salininema proteolyticum TaxID=1607685 RepID=A0ABV8TWI9_9ACTN
MSSSNGPNKSPKLYASLFGPVRFELDGRPLLLPGRQLPKLMSLLALNPERPLSLELVIDLVWPDRVPKNAIRMAQNLVSRLRSILVAADGSDVIVEQRTVTLVGIDSDVARFESLVCEARAEGANGDFNTVCSRYDAALNLVAGTPLEGVDDVLPADAARLRRMIDQARTALLESLLNVGDHGRAIEVADEILSADPLSQSATKNMMIAHYQRGEIQKACDAYLQLKERLRVQLGLDPNTELLELYPKILRGELTTGARPATSSTEPPSAIPRQLPTAPANFLGRRDIELKLEKLLSQRGSDGHPVVIAVNGVGGIGKSALAVHTAYQAAREFPDGQLYVNLHAATPDTEPLTPKHVLQRFLRAFGKQPDDGQDTDEAAAQFRSVTADKKLLIVLDDAGNAEQVQPLLPSGGECAVIITSRRPLTSISEAVTIPLDTLDESCAVDLLTTGTEHLIPEARRDALSELSGYCGGLPLALCILAARLKAGPPEELHHLLDSMRDESERLDEFTDDKRSLTAGLRVSVRDLETTVEGREAVRLFTALGTHWGPDISIEAAAASIDTTVARSRRLMRMLTESRLVNVTGPGRYQMHDLVRLYAGQLAKGLTPTEYRDVVGRTRTFYLQSVRHVLDLHSRSTSDRLNFLDEDPGCRRVSLNSPEEAYDWIDREFPNILELGRQSLEPDSEDKEFLALLSLLSARPMIERGAMRTAVLHLMNLAKSAMDGLPLPYDILILTDLSGEQIHLKLLDEAKSNAETAYQAADRFDFHKLTSHLAITKARITWLSGRPYQALNELDQAYPFALNREIWVDVAWINTYKSRILGRLGRWDEALEATGMAVAVIADKTSIPNHRRTLATFQNSLSDRLIRVNKFREAYSLLTELIAYFIEIEDTRSRVYASTLWNMGEACYGQGRADEARRYWDESATIARSIELINDAELEEVLTNPRPHIPER